MTIYEYSTSMLLAGGSTSTTSLNIRGGIMHQLLVRANTSGTVFRANLTDHNDIVRTNYGFSTGELNDTDTPLAMTGRYTINVTNASQTDTVRILLAVREQ